MGNVNSTEPSTHLERYKNRKEFEEKRAENIEKFLVSHPPSVIAKELDEHIIDQPHLTKAVAEYVYYQVLRLKYPLPSRPMLICGPSGSGKTEVWRTVSKLYGDTIKILICDCTRLTQEGWKGSTKISSIVRPYMSYGIVVFDECDKMFEPHYDAANTNVSYNLQSEFLRIVEENHYLIKEDKTESVERYVDQLGVVFVGAFESIRMDKEEVKAAPIGFGSEKPKMPSKRITKEDLYEYGMMPELLGRISTICQTKPLSLEDCIKINRNEHSRVGVLAKVLSENGFEPWENIGTTEIVALMQKSNVHRYGVRAVISKIENVMLSKIFEHGIYPSKIPDNTPEHTP